MERKLGKTIIEIHYLEYEYSFEPGLTTASGSADRALCVRVVISVIGSSYEFS